MRAIETLGLSAFVFSVLLMAVFAPRLMGQADDGDDMKWHKPSVEGKPTSKLPTSGEYVLENPAFPGQPELSPAPNANECKWVIRYTIRNAVTKHDSDIDTVTVLGVELTYGKWNYSGSAQFWAAHASAHAEGQRTFKTYSADMPTIAALWEIEVDKKSDCGVGTVWTQTASVLEAYASRSLPIVTPSTASAQAATARKIACSQVSLDWEHSYGAEVPIPGGGATTVTFGPVSVSLDGGNDSAGEIKKDYSPSRSAQTSFARWDTNVWAKVLASASTRIDACSADSSTKAREFWIAIQLTCVDDDCHFYRNYVLEYVPDKTPIPVLRRVDEKKKKKNK